MLRAMREILVGDGGVEIRWWVFSKLGIEFSCEEGYSNTMMKFENFSIMYYYSV